LVQVKVIFFYFYKYGQTVIALNKRFEWDADKSTANKKKHGLSFEEITLKRIAEIKLFKDTDISDCPELTSEQLKRLKPRHPETFKQKKVVS
jgi:hypothetical protein